MKILSPFHNFGRARLDHDLMGRFDLPIYNTGADAFDNAISNFKGNAIYRSGYESMVAFQDCVFAEFKFNNQQQYIIVMYNLKFRFLSYDVNGNFGWVLDSGGVNPLEVATPYSLAECREVDYSQNDDVMIFTHKNYAPRKLTRLSANSFSFSTFPRTADPFINLETATVITAITQANPAVVTSAAHGYVTGDKVFITAVVGMEQVNDLIFTITRLTANTYSLDGIDSTAYDAYVSGGTAQRIKSTAITNITQANPAVVTSAAHTLSTGDIVTIFGVVGMTQVNGNTYTIDKINANSFSLRGINSTGFTAYSSGGRVRELEDYPACCLFYKGRLYYANTTLRVTTIFASVSGSYDNFTTTPVDDASALVFTVTDISQEIEWLFPGDNSLIVGATDGIVAVNGGSVGAPITAATVSSKPTSAPPCNSVYPLSKDGLIFYVSREGRNLYYFRYDLLTESFLAEDANFVSYDITDGGITRIKWKKDRNDLVYGVAGDGRMLAMNFNAGEKIIGWASHNTEGTFLDECVITDQSGAPQLFALVLRGSTYYIERQAGYVEFKQRNTFFTEYDEDDEAEARAAELSDDDAHMRFVAEQLKGCIYLDNALTVSNLKSNLITYNSGAGTITATVGVFVVGDVGKHIVYKTETGYEVGRFQITAYTSATVVSVTVLQTPTSNTYTNWYLSFNSLTGLSQYNGNTVGIVTDGSYYGDETISGGVLSLDKQVTHLVIGYKYRMVVKSFCLGFQLRADNSQARMKAINEFFVRCVSSAGGKVGSSPYKLQRVQELGNDDLNYLPPMPIDGTKQVSFSDDNQADKFFYLIQDEPLPFQVANVMVNANHSVTQ